MSEYNIKDTLVKRDRISEEEAERIIEEMRQEMDAGADIEELLYDIGLEPDYIEDLID